jgi:hypothetical protein
MVRFQNVRWYVEYEQAYQIFLNYPAVLAWVSDCEALGHAPAAIASVRAVVSQHNHTLKSQLSMFVDALDPLVRCCYELEGDKVLTLLIEVVEHIRTYI